MPSRLMTGPHQMRPTAGSFAANVHLLWEEVRAMWPYSRNVAGNGWSGSTRTAWDDIRWT